MVNIVANPEWKSVRVLEREEVALGGLGGNMNEQATSLVARTELLMQEKASNADLNAVGTGNRAYKTYADMDADRANIPVNSKVTVTNDSLVSNNGDWQWDGTEFTKSIYDPLTQAKVYTDEKTKYLEIERGINIFDKTGAQVGKYWGYQDGVLRDGFSTFAASELIEVEPSTEYQVPSFYSQQLFFADENGNYISGKANVTSEGYKFITPSNARYIGMTVEVAWYDTMILAKSSEFPKIYVPYTTIMPSLKINANDVENLYKDVRNDLGVHTLNTFDKTKALEGYYVINLTGELGYADGFYASDFIEVEPLTEYEFSSFYTQQGAIYDKNMVRISSFAEPSSDKKITTPANAKYIRFTIPVAQIDTLVFAESSRFPANFVPFGAVQIDNLIVAEKSNKPTEIWVTFDENSTDPTFKFKGKNAIQEAIDSVTDATTSNPYAVMVWRGVSKNTTAKDFKANPGYPAIVKTKDHVSIIGQGEHNTIVWAELPYDDADIGASADGNIYPRASYQTLYDMADDCVIKDITFVAKNLRYTNHLDDASGVNKTHRYENVGFIFKGNIGSRIGMGTGTHSGEEVYVVGGRSHSDDHIPVTIHNNIGFEKRSKWDITGHNFTSFERNIFLYMQNNGSLLEDQVDLVGCSFGGAAYRLDYVEVWLSANTANNYDSFNHAEWQISGYGNEPFLFNNEVEGQSLRFKTTATGIGNSIRFDKTSSAYPILIKNNQSNSISSLYLNNRVFINEYIVQDGSVGLPAQAFGCKDLATKNGAYDNGVNFTSLAKRLGDCSTANKLLVVIVNGVNNTITFNKNYSSMSNAQIVAEMNTQISGATIDLISYGRDYYPMITDVCEVAYNTGATYIPKGSVVAKSGGSVRLAQASDKVFGVALDDIPVQQVLSDGEKRGQGRLLKFGYVYADQSKAHFVLADSQNPAIGTRFNVNNGQLVTDVNGKISVDIDTGVISINC